MKRARDERHAPGALSRAQVAAFERDGILAVEGFIAPDEVVRMRAEAEKLRVDAERGSEPRRTFTTRGDQSRDEYFLQSAEQVSPFFDAVDPSSTNQTPSVNKIGHNLHELNPTFAKFSVGATKLRALVDSLGYPASPAIVQSMLIYKRHVTGTEVAPHRDETFLYTDGSERATDDPRSCLGLWFALDDATVQNGCLWAHKGSHKHVNSLRRYVRRVDDDGHVRMAFESDQDAAARGGGDDPGDPPVNWSETGDFVPLEVKVGTVE